ncbi:hypothetical protein BGZ49_005937, partial [Haplosporangium sp. Z 27]
MVKITASLFVVAIAAISTSMAAPVKSDATIKTDAAVKSAVEPSEKSANQFSSSVMYTGRATWFTDGYGACNESWDGESEAIVALNAHQMGSASWGNPVCNKRVQITNTNNGKTVNARVVDKCPGD